VFFIHIRYRWLFCMHHIYVNCAQVHQIWYILAIWCSLFNR
jgi:hypothetical protein